MLVMQDPTDEQSTYLLESLLDVFGSADTVAGAFAFASAAGVRLLTDDFSFKNVARQHRVDLVVGIDAVTNCDAINTLAAVAKEHPKVKVRAFLNPRRSALFHPKVCWTKHRNGGCLIAGSGNLTEGGLLGNWEAYAISRLNSREIGQVEGAWNSWTRRHSAYLLPLDSPQVRRAAAANNVMAPEGDLPMLIASRTPHARRGKTLTRESLLDTAEALVAEIPRSDNRWNQANFHKEDFEGFFGARPGRLSVFRHVKANGRLAAYERKRPPVKVRSHNFRFELAAAAGIPYPDPGAGRPIGVFIRVATRAFLYRLILPSDKEYGAVSVLLEKHVGKSRPRMRTLRITVAELRRKWPNAPFWKLQI